MLLDRALQKKYQSGMKFLLYVAVRHLGYEDINYLHSIDKGLYSKIIAPRTLNNEDIEKIKVYINELINKDLKITKKVVTIKVTNIPITNKNFLFFFISY